MLERLKAYREQFEEEKHNLEVIDDDEYITEMLKKYEAELREKLTEEHNKAIADKDWEIQVIDKLIKLEEEKLISATDELTAFEPENSETNY